MHELVHLIVLPSIINSNWTFSHIQEKFMLEENAKLCEKVNSQLPLFFWIFNIKELLLMHFVQ